VLQAACRRNPDLGTLIEAPGPTVSRRLLMAVDGLTDPHNLGAIVRMRSARCPRSWCCPSGAMRPDRRGGQGACRRLEHCRWPKVQINLNRSLEQLKGRGLSRVVRPG